MSQHGSSIADSITLCNSITNSIYHRTACTAHSPVRASMISFLSTNSLDSSKLSFSAYLQRCSLYWLIRHKITTKPGCYCSDTFWFRQEPKTSRVNRCHLFPSPHIFVCKNLLLRVKLGKFHYSVITFERFMQKKMIFLKRGKYWLGTNLQFY